MKTIGLYLSEQRLKAGIQLDTVSKQTKIRLDYLKAIEADDFSKLPSAAFVKGFIRSYALCIKTDPEKALAIFRRDFDQNQKGKVVPRGMVKPIESGKGFWSPRTTSIVGVIVVLAMFAVYGFVQARSIFSGPFIDVYEPTNFEIIQSEVITVTGKSNSDASVTINAQPVILALDGSFSTELLLSPGEHVIEIVSTLRDGRSTLVTRTITIN